MLALFNIESWLKSGGILLLALIVFAESGLFIGFFLPGDSLLFLAGFFSSAAGGNYLPPLPVVALVAFAAAVIGDQVGYLFGLKVGPSLFQRPESRFFKPSHVVRAQLFFDKYGSRTIVLARFVPIVRTFAPIVAGVGKMRYRTFLTYNIIGGFLWAVGVTTLGYFVGQVDWVKNNIEAASVGIVLLSLIPVMIEFVKHRRHPLPVAEHTTADVSEHAAD